MHPSFSGKSASPETRLCSHLTSAHQHYPCATNSMKGLSARAGFSHCRCNHRDQGSMLNPTAASHSCGSLRVPMCSFQSNRLFKSSCRYQKKLKISLLWGNWKGRISRTGLRGLQLQQTLLKQQHRNPSKAFTSGGCCSFPQGKQLENPVGLAHVGNPNSSAHSCTDCPPDRAMQELRGAQAPWGHLARSVRSGNDSQGLFHQPSQEQDTQGGTGAAPALGHQAPPLGMRTG